MPAHDKTSVDRPAGATPLLNTHFEVIFDGLPALGFCSVEGIEAVVEENVSASTRKGSVKERPARLVLQRAATGSRDLWEWYAARRDGGDVRRNGRIVIMDASGQPVLQVALKNAQPLRWRLGRLDALQPDVLGEEIELVVEVLNLT